MSRPDSQSWIAAKANGDRAEVAVAVWFQSVGFDVFSTIGRASFDLLLQAQVEVKRDLRAVRTGHVAVEVAYNGQPSGIITTTATWWAIVIGQEAVIVAADALRQYVLTTSLREVVAGDMGKSLIRLVPNDALKRLPKSKVVTLPKP
jgi:hypothetical protein